MLSELMLWRCTPEEAMAKIGGYTLALDMTDRQAQVLTGWDKKQFWDQRHWDVDHLKGEAKKKGHPWSVSKGWDTSLPVSPKIVFYSVSQGSKWKPASSFFWFVFQVSKFLSASRHSGGVENPNELEVSRLKTGFQTQLTILVSNIFFFSRFGVQWMVRSANTVTPGEPQSNFWNHFINFCLTICEGNWLIRININITRDMIFPVADLLSFISHKFSLSPGDLVLTGTPAGLDIVHRFGSLHVCCLSPDHDINNERMLV